MPIVNRQPGPAQGAQVIGRALRDLRGPVVLETLGGASINMSQPLPIYRLGLEDITGQEFLDRAKQVGWRYLLEQDGGRAYADLAENQVGGGQAFASLAKNANAERLNEAAHLAEDVAGALPDCEARILDIPALHISALWLAGAQPAFIPYIDPATSADRIKVGVDREFLSHIRERATALRLHFEAPPSNSTAG